MPQRASEADSCVANSWQEGDTVAVRGTDEAYRLAGGEPADKFGCYYADGWRFSIAFAGGDRGLV